MVNDNDGWDAVAVCERRISVLENIVLKLVMSPNVLTDFEAVVQELDPDEVRVVNTIVEDYQAAEAMEKMG
jgi:hypothetical protein